MLDVYVINCGSGLCVFLSFVCADCSMYEQVKHELQLPGPVSFI